MPSHLSHAIDSIWSVISLPLLRLQPFRCPLRASARRIPIVRISGDRKTLLTKALGEGGRAQNVGSVPVLCHGDGELLPVLSCNREPNVPDLIQHLGEGEKLVRAVFRALPLCSLY